MYIGLQRILSSCRKTIEDYSMIEDGDKIAVGLSNGKDSITLLYSLAELRRFYPKKFSIIALTIDMNFDYKDNVNLEEKYAKSYELCKELDVELHVIKSDIAEIVFDKRKEKNPCSLCSKLRRGMLCSYALELGCNKLALGHHFDDVVNTFMLNLFYEGRLGCFSPTTYLEDKNLTIIRPLIYTEEKTIKYFASHNDLPIMVSKCPKDHSSEREEVGRLLRTLERDNKGLRHRILCAMQKAQIDGYKE